ncbi:MAG: hypothetical protein IPI46_04790 [Bacteroidetes bacterium]|nr:hypothetical protein [Bacteroidota bacterium]
MNRLLITLFLFAGLLSFSSLRAQEYDKICSKQYNYCFQIPANFMMLTTGGIEEANVMYKTVDGSSTLAFSNGDIKEGSNFHKLFLSQLNEYSNNNFRVTIKKEYSGFFIMSGYTQGGKGFYQKVIKNEDAYTSAYLEFPKGNARFSNVSQLLFDYFEKVVVN